jgi:hypothetical protein
MNVRPAIVLRAAALSALALVAACGKLPGWSAEERQNARELCLTQVGESFELSKAQAYCGCLVAKTIQEFPTYADADKLGTGKDGDRLGDACVEELHLTERDAPNGSSSADPGSLRPQSSVATEPRTYGDWHVIFAAADPSNDEVDTWQAVTSDETSGALLAYVCEPGGCGLLLEPETRCDDGQTARFSLLFTQDNSPSNLDADAHCLPNGAWAFESLDPILDQLRALPDTLRVSLRGANLDFSLDGATGALAYAEKAANEHGDAADAAPPERGAAPAR